MPDLPHDWLTQKPFDPTRAEPLPADPKLIALVDKKGLPKWDGTWRALKPRLKDMGYVEADLPVLTTFDIYQCFAQKGDSVTLKVGATNTHIPETTWPLGKPYEPKNMPDNAGDDMSLEAKAVALLVDHKDWTDQQIADKVPCYRTTLYGFPKFVAARKIMKTGNAPPRGSKDKKTGKIEAVGD